MTKLIIVDDHNLVASGIAQLFSNLQQFEVIGVFDDAQDAMKRIKILEPDVVLTDLEMPTMNGLEMIESLKKDGSKANFILLTMHFNQQVIQQAMKVGIQGYLPKNADEYEFIQCVEAVAVGRNYYSQKAMELLAAPSQQIEITGLLKTQVLTDREREILKLIAEGNATKEIADQLVIAVRTVETHRKSIMSKLEVNNVAGMVRIAVQEGLVD
ncbi:MAG: response regulator transcription factor [Bacteroidota bacterium]